ncbi:MAG TPA: M64 family metallopeptidase [Planctomycetota bacterium]|nr:M64 family metallopeptidase [Planctomycetota bacterium]
MSLARCMLLIALAAIAPQSAKDKSPDQRVWVESGPREASVDVLFVGDGYTSKELARAGKYWKDVDRCAKRLFQDPPFSTYKARFNVRALLLESKQAGCDASADKNDVDTALNCRFDTREGRLLVFEDSARLKTLVEQSGQTDIVFVMVNTERYGGAGTLLHEIDVRGKPLPAPTYAAQDTRSFLIAVHELGHSFADLADEYADKDLHATFPLPKQGDLGPANVSLASAFDRSSFERLKAEVKWRHFLELPGASKEKWFWEGGYYRESGVFRPWNVCRMREHEQPFCPICCEQVARAIHGACGIEWDDAAWHKSQPLAEWH